MNSPHFFIYDASAGSGKTYTITCEYLCILLKQDKVFAFQNILAITFTNKAAAEMKQRIIKALVYFAEIETDESHQNLLEDVASQIHLSKEEIQKKSLQILKYLIPNYAGFEVSTIDSFNHRIIRTFAKDLSLSQNFEVDLDTQPYVDQAVENLINDVGIDKELTEWLVEFVHYKINQDKSGNIRFDLEKFAALVLNENNYQALEKLQQYSLKDLKQGQSKIKDNLKLTNQKLIKTATEFFHLIENHFVEESHFSGKYIPKYFRKLIEGVIPNKFEAQWHNIKETNFYNKSAKASVAEKIDAIRPEIEELFLKSKELCLNFHLSERVQKSFVPLSMISEINNRINQIKTEEGILFVNDFNRIISKHIKQQPAPFIYERLGEKFRHYFIDEFQDTSKLQWQNLIPLVDNAITSQHDDGISGNLYLVGDVKQSIYEWRGGDPNQFLDLSQGNINPFPIKAKHEVLEDNWRSAKTIVDFNNQFFHHAANYLSDSNHQLLYKNANQNIKKHIEGYVDIRFLPKLEDKELIDEQRIQNLQDIILSLKSQGYDLSDICILVRQNKFGTAIAEAFNDLDQPIPVISQESLLIASDAKVHLLNQFLKLIEQYHEETCIDFMFLWLNHTHIEAGLYHELLSKNKSLNQQNIFDNFRNINIDFDLKIYSNLSMYDKAEYALRVLHLEQKANAYIQFYLDEIFNFSISKSGNMTDFLTYWEDQKHKKSISTSQNSEAVNIMTIHKSKGLQFPVVIYAHANFKLADLSKTSDWVELDEEEFGVPLIYENISATVKNLSSAFEEAYDKNISKVELANLNTAYVCMTRAVEQLYILCDLQDTKTGNFENMLFDFLKEKNIYEEEKDQYSFGKIETKKKKSASETPILSQTDFESYAAQDFYKELTAEIPLDIARADAVTFGEEVHDILQHINYKEDLETLDISTEKLSMLNSIVNHHEISDYFKNPWKIYNETEIIFNGEIFRPDRLCIQDNNAVIIDYKTGIEKSIHLEQLTNYKNAVEALGFKIKKAILVYIRKQIYTKTL